MSAFPFLWHWWPFAFGGILLFQALIFWASPRHRVQMSIMGTGVVSNFTALSVNAGRMPVTRAAHVPIDAIHVWAGPSTRLVWLTDQVVTPDWLGGAASAGDITLLIGLAVGTIWAVTHRHARSRS